MRKILFPCFLLWTLQGIAQADTSKWLRAFPITGYMVDLNDSVKVVQVEMPEGMNLDEKQLGLAYGVYKKSKEDAVPKGYGRCHLVKGVYHYFSIGHNNSGKALEEGDLIYTYMEKTPIFYSQIAKLASHFIQLQDVYEKPFYDRYLLFTGWQETDEMNLLDSMVADIRFTGEYFISENPSMDRVVKEGKFKDRKILYIMAECQVSELKDFLDYMNARPRLYAGKKWKIAEIFATWLSEGAPMVVK